MQPAKTEVRSSTINYQNPNSIFSDIFKNSKTCLEPQQFLRKAKTFLRKKNKIEVITHLYFKLYCKIIVIKTVCYW